ncbi:hypothetical protein TNCV_2302801 [Trichonephila clavipes]|nr:hypothetical protein TNCV_2302801 [Trichonephila clavipes]
MFDKGWFTTADQFRCTTVEMQSKKHCLRKSKKEMYQHRNIAIGYVPRNFEAWSSHSPLQTTPPHKREDFQFDRFNALQYPPLVFGNTRTWYLQHEGHEFVSVTNRLMWP